jgi:antitoxin ParD1/3/4
MATTTLKIALPETLDAYVAERVKEGGFSDPGDYVRALIREDRERQAQEHLEALLREGLESGQAAPLDEAEWASLRDEVEAEIAGKPKSA